MKKSSIVRALTGFFLFFGLVSNGQAKDLAEQLDGLFGPDGITLTPTIPSHQAHFNSVSAASQPSNSFMRGSTSTLATL